MSVIDEYLAKVSEPQKAELQRLRKIVQKSVPDAQEAITYAMPGFKYKGKYLVAFNALKDHIGLYPAAHAIEAMQDKLTNYSLSKGTVRYTLDNPLPEALVKEIVLIRTKDIEQS